MDSQTTDIMHFTDIFIMTSQFKHWTNYVAQSLAYDITTEKFANLRDVRSLMCKVKVLNCLIPETWKLLNNIYFI